MPKTFYLTLEEIVAIHENQINKWGGGYGIRDFGLLASAVARPQATFAGEDLYPDLFLKAAVLMHSIILNHAFSDGNKRTGTVSAARFLYINGYELEVSQRQLVRAARSVEDKKWDIEKIASWLKKNSKKI